MNRGFHHSKSDSTVLSEYHNQPEEYNHENYLYQNIEKQTNTTNVLNCHPEEILYENIGVNLDQIYENVSFLQKSSCYDESNFSDNISVYENVKILRNSVQEVNDIVNQNPGEISVPAKYKTENMMTKENLRVSSFENSDLRESSNNITAIPGGLYYARRVNTE